MPGHATTARRLAIIGVGGKATDTAIITVTTIRSAAAGPAGQPSRIKRSHIRSERNPKVRG